MSHHSPLVLVLITGITVALSACATGPDLDITVHESERGAVYVERVSDRSFQATHPVTLSENMMARVLRGVVIKDSREGAKKSSADKQEAVRAFGDKDIDYLAPLLVEGLSKAASDQQVGFRVVRADDTIASHSNGVTFCVSSVRFPGVCENEQTPGQVSEESTEGLLYAYGQSLYLTLTEYRHRTERAESDDRVHRRISNSTGLMNHTVDFTPESAKRSDSYRTARATNATLVIDYDALAAMPAATDLRSTAAQQAMPVRSEPSQRDSDVDELRKELQDIKKKLAEQETERTRSTPSSSSKSAPRSTP